MTGSVHTILQRVPPRSCRHHQIRDFESHLVEVAPMPHVHPVRLCCVTVLIVTREAVLDQSL